MDIRWSTHALQDLAGIEDYHREAPLVARDILARIIASARFLVSTPGAGPVVMRDRRKWRARGTRYIVFYRIAHDHLRILRVLHERQDHSAW